MDDEKNRQDMLSMLDLMLDESASYEKRLEAYDYLSEDCEEIVDEMLKRRLSLEGDTSKMLMEVLANYKGNKAVYMGLVSELYKGEDVALFARLIGSYGNEQGIETLKGFLNEYEPDYNEFMEIRNAVEELGGYLDYRQDFSNDPLYRYLKGLDDVDENSRKSPFENENEKSVSEADDRLCDNNDEDCGNDGSENGCECDDCGEDFGDGCNDGCKHTH